jgi:hypothetical protein
MSVKTAVSSTRHAAICWRFGEPQSAAVVARLSILPELGARGAYRASSSQIYVYSGTSVHELNSFLGAVREPKCS